MTEITGIISAILSIVASILGILSFKKSKANEEAIKQLQSVGNSEIYRSNINQAGGDISIDTFPKK